MPAGEYLDDLFSSQAKSLHLSGDGIHAGPVRAAKTVRKGWGEERWLVAESAPWGFKLIHIKAGQRTSLQYHERKEEACLLLSGQARLYHAPSPDDEVAVHLVGPGDIVHLEAGHVHRFEGVTDMTMVEVSTADLDDVIRIADDFSRGNGRIAKEHEGTSQT